jgi:hypothetical protein
MIKLPRTALSPTTVRNVHANFDLLVKHITTRLPAIYIRKAPLISDPATSIATTTLYTTSAKIQEFGHFRIVATLVTTRAGTGGTASVTIGWNNGSSNQSATSGNIALNTLGSEVDFVLTFLVGTGQNITYATTVGGSTGNPAYSLNIKLEFLS